MELFICGGEKSWRGLTLGQLLLDFVEVGLAEKI
jgi:hypothetical protein